MKYKRDLILLGIMVITAVCAAGITIFCGGSSSRKKEDLQITASFYPMYIIARNVADGVDGINVGCMTQNQTGCLHDYQITTGDMKLLETTDIFIVNGGGMESFLEDVISNYPLLNVVDAGLGLESVKKEENAHFWLNPVYYIVQIQTVADGLAKLDQAHAEQYQKNAADYIEKVRQIAERMQTELEVPHIGVIVFHDAFIYLAEYLGLEVTHTMELDGETSLNAGEVAEIMEEIREGRAGILFTEAQYSTEIADIIGKETGVDVYVIDSLVTGEEDNDSYLRGMESNLEVLKQAASRF